MKRVAPLALLLTAACGAGPGPEAVPAASVLRLQPANEAAVLDLVNYPGTDLDVLANLVGLDASAAYNILAQRNGVDGLSPSTDDVYFATIADLAAVPSVDDGALTRLETYALAHPAPRGEVVEGVSFRGWESEAVVWGVNQADLATLDALLDVRAANGLVATRPFASVAQMGPVAYVGPTALGQLRGHALPWWNALRGVNFLAGTFDGVTFDEATARVAIEIANQASFLQLTRHGLTTSPANYLIAARPYATLAQVAAVYGVGPATMAALRSYAQSGAWGAPETCISDFEAAVGPHLADVLFLSESDRPFELVSYPGAGASAPTAASVLALVGAPAGSTAELRQVYNYYRAFEPSSNTADPSAATAIRAAFDGQLTDVIYVAVFAPPGSPDTAVVQVYLVGRTACGDLVGIRSIAIET
jgi:DNA uptake protein ComE-like DNA-binding protein